MKTKIIYAIAVAAIALVIWLVLKPPLSDRYYNPPMQGLTKEEVIRQVGKPTSIPEAGGGDIWIYQFGMDPEASVEFRDGKVTEVWTAQRDGFKKP